jgi:hypothetical protein
MIGYVERFCVSDEGVTIGLLTAPWLAVCRNAYEMRRLGPPVATQSVGTTTAAAIG